jgi:hypothetical protein
LNVQFGDFPLNDGTAAQHNSDGSAGNIQINDGVRGAQYVGNGYSFNLQYNVAYCRGQNDQITTLRGNIRIINCSGTKYFYHNAGDVIYKIYEQSCNNNDFMEVRDGKVYIELCVGI